VNRSRESRLLSLGNEALPDARRSGRQERVLDCLGEGAVTIYGSRELFWDSRTSPRVLFSVNDSKM
jgi:hypothetical protein